ncbi:3-phenylpropionate/trans-cinnamate dioxygenase ferredoxin subunit [Raineyella antarctica]|uniref:3-phenylpropionate/trans-cinnamate dioxygenase ferredoxin subunit n=1 Tax=Raineyella antarctica TaxID=1577474 RepID=A0A1G6H403_9ACTN|nr:Rieske 2Fe-2S domain-containing protein [Raineyella antarctica]SDB88655.1 3-phenylpropionate/trans-cinnamate dioxygenase ferredoxin subunit [Raineyella antarctica]
MAEGIRIAAVGDIADQGVLVVPKATTGTVEDIAVFRDGEAYYALDDMCSHQEALLSRGWLEEGEVVCPLHLARFRLTDGMPTCFPANWPTPTHRVEVRDEELWLFPGVPAEGAPVL